MYLNSYPSDKSLSEGYRRVSFDKFGHLLTMGVFSELF